jgi:hypothetical protein
LKKYFSEKKGKQYIKDNIGIKLYFLLITKKRFQGEETKETLEKILLFANNRNDNFFILFFTKSRWKSF